MHPLRCANDVFCTLSQKSIFYFSQDYEDFCRQTNLATQKERLRTVGYNRSVSQKVVWAERKRKDEIKSTVLKHIDYNKKNGIISMGKQFGKKIGKHAKDYGLSPSIPEHREQMRGIINKIVTSFDELRIGQFRSQPDEVFFYIKGEDVVIMNKNNEFVTIMKGGRENVRVKNARIIDV